MKANVEAFELGDVKNCFMKVNRRLLSELMMNRD